MSELLNRPLFLKDLQQPFFLKESPSIVGEAPPIDVVHLARMAQGDRSVEFKMLELFDCEAEMLLRRMQEAGSAGVASLAHALIGLAQRTGAWRVAEATEALGRAAESHERARALETLNCAIVEARLAICAMRRVSALAAAVESRTTP